MTTRRTFYGGIAGVVAVLLLVCAIGVGLALWKLRGDAIERTKQDANHIATILAQQGSLSSQSIDLVIDETLSHILNLGGANEDFRANMSSKAMHDYLVGRLAKLPQADVIGVVDQTGAMVASTRGWPAPPADFSARDHFLHFENTQDSSLFLSAPALSKSTGKWTMFFSRRVSAPSGEFLGVVVVGAQPLKFMSNYDAIRSIPGASSLLLRRDGLVYLRTPDPKERAGDRLPAGNEWYRVVASGGGFFRSPGVFDNQVRWVAARPIDRYPLVVNVAVSETNALRIWRDRAIMIAAGALIATAGFASLLGLVFVNYRKAVASEAKVTEREALLASQSRELSLANMRVDAALTHMKQGLAMFDQEDRIVIHNRGYAEMYGLTSEQMPPGTPLLNILQCRVDKGVFTGVSPEQYLRRHAEHFNHMGTELELLRDGRYILVSHQPMPDGCWVTTHEDVTEQQRIVTRIAHMAHHDGLTNLANRNLFLDTLQEMGGNPRAEAGFAVLIIDLDQFKAVNDTFGHVVGDELLWAVAGRLRQATEPRDLVARLGGDEFAIARPLGANEGVASIEDLASRLLTLIREPYTVEDRDMRIGLSIGVAVVADRACAPNVVMRYADLALYRAKSDGRNRYRVFEAEMEEHIQSRRNLAIDLDAALTNRQLEVHYQPVVDAATFDVRSMEALVRWEHPTRGRMSPMEFVSVAEEAGHIQRLGEFVLDRACRDAVKWPDDVKVAVNVSAIQVAEGDLAAKVRRALDQSGLPPRRLELEITETVLLADSDENIAVLHELHDMGIAIVLDDFGTGFSSLSYLNRFPLDKIKIDKSFIDGLGFHAGSAAIVSATTSIARAFDAVTTAEGVESEEQSRLLRAAGVTQMQGYFFGKPLPAESWEFRNQRVWPRMPNPLTDAA